MRYVTRRITVEAMQWTGNNTDELLRFVQGKLGHGATFEITKSREQWVQLDRSGDEEMHYILETDDWAVYKPEDSSLDVYDDETFRKTYVEEETHG